jgi:hypothetical protein
MEQSCCVCGEVLDPDNFSQCNFCGKSFHLAWSIHASLRNCGRYWIDERSCALMFICARCDQGFSASPPGGEGAEGAISP